MTKHTDADRLITWSRNSAIVWTLAVIASVVVGYETAPFVVAALSAWVIAAVCRVTRRLR